MFNKVCLQQFIYYFLTVLVKNYGASNMIVIVLEIP